MSERPADTLTDAQFWDNWWTDAPLPTVARRVYRNDYLNVILDTLDRHVPPGSRVLEIGGAPGTFLAYLAQNKGCRVTSMDISPQGNAATRRNFQLLGLPGTVLEADALAPPTLPAEMGFDVVTSWGFAEHFTDSAAVLRAHASRTKPGGLILMGFPNFLGINKIPLSLWAPTLLRHHHLPAMRSAVWQQAAHQQGLEVRAMGYRGGLSPRLWYVFDNPQRWYNAPWRLALRAGIGLWVRLPGSLNFWRGHKWSGYWIAVLQKPAA